MPDYQQTNHPNLLAAFAAEMKLNYGGMARLFGTSPRTISRWYSGGKVLSPAQLRMMAMTVYDRAPDLAAQIADTAGHTLADYGLGVTAATAPSVPTVPPAPSPRLVELAVCAAADVLDVPPRVARPALLAAVRVAREVGLDLAAIEAELGRAVGKR